jgi:hypothetical protein
MSVMDALALSSLYDEVTARLTQIDANGRAFHDATIRHLDRTDSDIECLNRRLMGIIEALDHIDARLQNIQQSLYDSRKQSQTSN